MTHDAAIEIEDLSKFYPAPERGGVVRALDGVNLSISKGSVYGLLGPNGAGKSTLINILAGLILGSSGRVRIWGYEALQNPREAKLSIGVMLQESGHDPDFTPAKFLDTQAGLYGVPKSERRTMELLEMVGLSEQAHSRSNTLSGGMKRRLMMARTLVHSPPIVVLDEPTAGVDVELRQQLWNNIRALNRRGVTVLLTTHYLHEAELLCDRIAIINKGKIIADDTKDALLSYLEIKAMTITLTEALFAVPPALAKYNPVLEGGHTLTLRYNPVEHNAGQVLAALAAENLGIADISTRSNSLEDVFLALTRAA